MQRAQACARPGRITVLEEKQSDSFELTVPSTVSTFQRHFIHQRVHHRPERQLYTLDGLQRARVLTHTAPPSERNRISYCHTVRRVILVPVAILPVQELVDSRADLLDGVPVLRLGGEVR